MKNHNKKKIHHFYLVQWKADFMFFNNFVIFLINLCHFNSYIAINKKATQLNNQLHDQDIFHYGPQAGHASVNNDLLGQYTQL